MKGPLHFKKAILSQDDLVVSVSVSHAVGRGFTFQPGHTKDHHENGTDIKVGIWQCDPTV